MASSHENTFEAFGRRMAAMHGLTRNAAVVSYWQFMDDIHDHGCVPFVISGALDWKSESGAQVHSSDQSFWLRSHSYEQSGKHWADNPRQQLLQWDLSLYETWGGLCTTPPRDDPSAAKSHLEQCIQSIVLATDTASLLTGASLKWYPARWWPQQNRPATTIPPIERDGDWKLVPLRDARPVKVVTDTFVTDSWMPTVIALQHCPNDSLRGVLTRALSWHAYGNNTSSGLTRFVSHWTSLELLSEFFFSRLIPTLTKSEKRKRIMALLSGIAPSNCLERASQCRGILEPSIREKMTIALPLATSSHLNITRLFEPEAVQGRSLYDIRNDIVHGNNCDHELEFSETVLSRIPELSRVAQHVLLACIQRIHILAPQLVPPLGRGSK